MKVIKTDMSEKTPPFESQQPLLIERSNQMIDVMHPTGRIVHRHTLNSDGRQVVEKLYEVRGQQIETIDHQTGVPTKYVHESKLTLDAQAMLAEQLHDSSLDHTEKDTRGNVRSIHDAPSLQTSETAPSVMIDMPESIKVSLDRESVRRRRLGMRVVNKLIDSEDVPRSSQEDSAE